MQTFGRFGKVVYGPQYTLDFQQKMKKKKNSYSAKAQYNISCSYPQLLSVPSDTESNCQCFEDERAATLPPNVEGKIKLYKYFAWSQAKYFQGM